MEGRSSYTLWVGQSGAVVMVLDVYKINQPACISLVCLVLQFVVLKENRSNEGTCIGVSRWPVRDYSHRTTTDMWLYRAYSGNLYHGGEKTETLSSFTEGDYITCVLDMDAQTLSFGKNGEVCLDTIGQYFPTRINIKVKYICVIIGAKTGV